MVRLTLNITGAVFSLATIIVVMVALLVGIIFWIYGRDLPSHESLAQYRPPTISRIYSGEGRLIDEFARERRLFTPADEIPNLVKQAFISAEDKNFYVHRGYDVRSIIAAGVAAIQTKGEVIRGASTITQQVMKNFLLSGDRRIERKIKEILLATRLEQTLDKESILELYLNEIFLGQNSYGVTAAAQTYFNKTLDKLEPHEAAFLASLPKAPSQFHPVRGKERLIARRNFVLKEMTENGYLDQSVYAAEIAKPLKSVQNGDFASFRNSLPPRDYFTDEIRRQLTKDFGEAEFFTEGLAIRATIDAEMQDVAAIALREALEAYDRSRGVWNGPVATIAQEKLSNETDWRNELAAVEVARDIVLPSKWYPAVVLELTESDARLGIEGIDTEDGGAWIKADDIRWARSRSNDGTRGARAEKASDLFAIGDVILVREEYSEEDNEFLGWSLRQIPEVEGAFVAMDVNNGRVLAMQGGFSYQHSVFNRSTQAMRQPGSAFKPLVYATALDNGYSPATIVLDAPIELDTPQGLWRPQNATKKFYGATPLRTGIERSRNLMTVRLARHTGMDIIAEYAEKFGVYDDMGLFLANALGSEETTLYRMVAAYSMFANGGERVQPTLVDRIQDRTGQTIFRRDERTCQDCKSADLEEGVLPLVTSKREKVIDAITAYQLTSMMQGVVSRGTASASVNLPVPIAGKTGTTNEARDVWFIGFSSNIAAGCYIGYDQPRPLGRAASGGAMCGPVFQRFMSEAIEKYGGGKFLIPSGGHFIKIDRNSGARLNDDASGADVVAEFFRDGEEPDFSLTVGGGFVIGSDLKIGDEDSVKDQTGTDEDSEQKESVSRPSFGEMSSGGLY
ncbi:MAG: PBP1A family penicillin-binding protein [Aestuariivita sp.]|nr:PBP1A family penicillin-binding protein [Aestuariivita sp.]MCY4347869.1 PBP1A family penicillin-binding protein [Aestuariivita sp.]